MFRLKLLDLGALAAEDDQLRLADSSMFQQTDAWTAMLDPGIPLILGRKGSGKTALRIGVQHHARSRQRLTVSIGFRDFATKPLAARLAKLNRNAEFDAATFFRSLWRYLLGVASMDAVLTAGVVSSRLKDELEICRNMVWHPNDLPNCLTDNHRFSLYRGFRDALDKLDASLGSGSIDVTYPVTPLFRQAERKLVGQLNDDLSVLVILDDFDEAYENFSDITQTYIVGLLDAIRDIRAEYPGIRHYVIKALIPEDAVTARDYSHLDHIPHEYIRWTAADLQVLLGKRLHRPVLSHFGGIPKVVNSLSDAEKVLDRVFLQLSGHNDYRTAASWILHCSLQRPRDILFIVQALIKRKCQQDSEASALEEHDLFNFLPDACKELADKVKGEYSRKYKELNAVLDLFRGQDAECERDVLLDRLGGNVGEGGLSAEQWLTALYEMGYLGVVCETPSPGFHAYTKKRVLCACHGYACADAPGERFVVHRVFWESPRVKPPEWPFLYA